ncbi:MAG TPA: L,D-transpeptidase family protein, partial [Thermoleophilia bacterium]|nr:L,D-transpeptidase family protein [Thermoleophilia bacterium]
PPLVTGSDPASDATLAAPPTLIVLHYSEPLAATPLPTAVMPGGPAFTVTVSGSDVRLKPRRAILPGAAYQVTVDGVRDLAGNVAAAAVVDFTVDKGATAIKAVATPAAVVYGSRTVVKGTVSRPGVLVILYRCPAGETTFTRIASFTASSTGAFTFRPAPVAATAYRLYYAGDEHWLPATTEFTVKVKPRIGLTASPREFFLGRRTVLSGVVAPAHPGATVVLQRLLNGTWTDWRTFTLNASSRFATTYKPTRWGLRYFRVRMDADTEHPAGLSSRLRVVVDNPNPHHISILFKKFIVIDISECHLYYYETGRVVRRIDVVLGKPSTPTPRGQWAVYTKSVNPGGPFGVYAMFYYRGYGIHGTNEPWLLSLWPRYFSHGCCRMSNANITWLWPQCPIGTPVRNVY